MVTAVRARVAPARALTRVSARDPGERGLWPLIASAWPQNDEKRKIMTSRWVRALLFASAAGASVLSGCGHETGSPSPSAAPAVSPDLVCATELTTSVTVAGGGFAPMPNDVLQDRCAGSDSRRCERSRREPRTLDQPSVDEFRRVSWARAPNRALRRRRHQSGRGRKGPLPSGACSGRCARGQSCLARYPVQRGERPDGHRLRHQHAHGRRHRARRACLGP